MMRVVVNGGRAAEKMSIGPDGFGAVVVGKCRLDLKFLASALTDNALLYRRTGTVRSRYCWLLAPRANRVLLCLQPDQLRS